MKIYTLVELILIFIADQANINYEIVLGGKTKLEGKWIDSGAVANLAFPMGENIFIVARVSEKYLKMVKIRVTGETTFDWIEAKYVVEGNYPTVCKAQETFTEECFVGTSVKEPNYSVELVAKPQESKQKEQINGKNCILNKILYISSG